MTQKQAIAGMKIRYPGCYVNADIIMWDFGMGDGIETHYKVYAGQPHSPRARGEGASFQEAFDNCKEF